jgi:hypothetical protein
MNKSFSTLDKTSPTLAFCLLMDAIGLATYVLPILGEFADVIWAPVSAFIFFRTFGGWKGAFGGIFNFVEELMPGLDFIPTFTIMYFMNRGSRVNTSSRMTITTN